jgi:hypothetical protein
MILHQDFIEALMQVKMKKKLALDYYL